MYKWDKELFVVRESWAVHSYKRVAVNFEDRFEEKSVVRL
jgi:hypothetical protein